MNKESLEQFMKQVAGSKQLQARIGEKIVGDALIALGAEHGCEFTVEDLQESVELSDEDLDGVAGGGKTTHINNYGTCEYSFKHRGGEQMVQMVDIRVKTFRKG